MTKPTKFKYIKDNTIDDIGIEPTDTILYEIAYQLKRQADLTDKTLELLKNKHGND